MKKIVKIIMSNISNKRNKGFYYIVISQLINKVFQISNGFLIVRLVSKSEFGVYSYAQNIITFILTFNGFGIFSGLLQFSGKNYANKEKKEDYYRYSFRKGIVSSIVLVGVILMVLAIQDEKIEGSKEILLKMSLYPIFHLFNNILFYIHRLEENNKIVGILSTLENFLLLILMLIGAKFFRLNGIILGKYTTYIIVILVSYCFFRKFNICLVGKNNLTKEEKKEINKYSYFSLCNSVLAQLLYTIDIFILGYLLMNKDIIATYKVATIIPFTLNFIPNVIFMYFHPKLVKKIDNIEYIRNIYKKYLCYYGGINIIIVLFMIIFSKDILRIIFGEEYLIADVSFKILCIGSFFLTVLKTPSAYILTILGKVKKLSVISLMMCFLNIFADIVLVYFYGQVGAAISTTVIMLLFSLITNKIIINYFKSRS